MKKNVMSLLLFCNKVLENNLRTCVSKFKIVYAKYKVPYLKNDMYYLYYNIKKIYAVFPDRKVRLIS